MSLEFIAISLHIYCPYNTVNIFAILVKIIKAQLEADNLCSPRAGAMADMVIQVATADNPRFDKARFLTACGLI